MAFSSRTSRIKIKIGDKKVKIKYLFILAKEKYFFFIVLVFEFNDGLMHSSCILLFIIAYIRTGKEKKAENEILKKISKFSNKSFQEKSKNKFKIFFLILTIAIGYNNYISSKMLLKGKTIFEIRIYHDNIL